MTYFWAFITGGLLCAAGQLLIGYTKLTPARILVGYVIAGVILSAAGIYPKLTAFAGAGAAVPLSGFGNLLAQGIREEIDAHGALGILTGGLTSAAGGVTAAMICGLAASLLFRAKDKM